ncbi:MAG: hypothetical protein P8N76_17665 [Pirellulaceae bacterium]|nr:hypothetical protein [Pirellulaceae bacterium]
MPYSDISLDVPDATSNSTVYSSGYIAGSILNWVYHFGLFGGGH